MVRKGIWMRVGMLFVAGLPLLNGFHSVNFARRASGQARSCSIPGWECVRWSPD